MSFPVQVLNPTRKGTKNALFKKYFLSFVVSTTLILMISSIFGLPEQLIRYSNAEPPKSISHKQTTVLIPSQSPQILQKSSNRSAASQDSNSNSKKIFLAEEINSPQYKKDKEMILKYSNIFQESRVQCRAMFDKNLTSIQYGIKIAKASTVLPDEYFINIAKNCDNFKRQRGYITSVLTKEEEEFPIAYSIIAYKDVEMVDRLLRQIYRPQNFYCIHIDLKAKETTYNATSAIANCFPNVFMSSTRISVQWGTISVLKPELTCMQDLYSKGYWKYFINLTGQEMPLKTNLEIVKILTAYQGANDIAGSFKGVIFRRWREERNGPPPLEIRPLKGSVHIVANRDFVDFTIHNETAKRFLNWAQRTLIPDEVYFTTLNHNPHLGIPGTYRGWPEMDRTNRKPFLARYKRWQTDGNVCKGYWSRKICIISTGDLPKLENRYELFANKFHLANDTVVLGCLEELLYNRTRDGFLGTRHFNTSFYEGLGFVINQVGRNITKKFVQGPKAI